MTGVIRIYIVIDALGDQKSELFSPVAAEQFQAQREGTHVQGLYEVNKSMSHLQKLKEEGVYCPGLKYSTGFVFKWQSGITS